MNRYINSYLAFIKTQGKKMIGPIEKHFRQVALSRPSDDGEIVDLRVMPKYIAYKAALLKEKMTLKFIVAVLTAVLLGQYATSKFEINGLYKKLREKEYILAPGVLNFTSASPQTVSDSYINDAATDFLLDLGNVNPSNINEQYRRLTRFMSQDLKIRFEIETSEWLRQVKEENISQILTLREKEVTANGEGDFKIVALGRAEFYSNHNYLGHEDQAFEMILRLIPPKDDKRWSLEINSLQWTKAETFRAKEKLSQPNRKGRDK